MTGPQEKTHRVVVIGGGISGLAAAYFIQKGLRETGAPFSLELVEKEGRAGGKFTARREGGFLVEGGPNGFLDSKPWTLDLAHELGLDESLLPSDEAAARRFIFSRGKLHELKASPMGFFTSNLLSVPGRVRIVGELFAPVTKKDQDTSLAEFAVRRLGREALERMLDPMVSGIFAGDPEKMSLRACFPRIAELEETYGGLIKGLFAIAAEKKKAKKRGEEVISSGPAGPGGVLTSFKEGISVLSDKLADDLGDCLHTGDEVVTVNRFNGRWKIRTKRRDFEADTVVLATPAHAAAGILSGVSSTCADIVARIPYSPMAIVGLGYDIKDLAAPPSGFGYLIPSVEHRRILGALWTSSIFPGHRAPKGKVLIRVITGGARDHSTPLLDESSLLKIVGSEIEGTMGLTAKPEFVVIHRWEKAIPMYTVGHMERLSLAEASLPKGIFLAGNAYRGIGINDCVRESKVVADRVVREVTGTAT
ncbi:MAG TPA: protoporphyrinogen oxidase [Proteobacteria bacterium]|nr:protoporphyrinogen oxidase [bacterium BMS3Abin14]HDL53150.1 protoporphyrinogen oxidase [Pseudomonadota bacterium]